MTQELAEARARLREIEDQLTFEIQRKLNGFREQFGIPITDVSVNMIDITTVSSECKDYRASVHCRAEI